MSGRTLLPKPSLSPTLQVEKPEIQVHKRQGVSLACDRCRKRKVKCDGNRPSCGPCVSVDEVCKYTSRGSSLAQRHEGLQESHSELRKAVQILCIGSDREAVDILKHVRQSQGLDDMVSSLCRHPTVVQHRLLSSDEQSNHGKIPQETDSAQSIASRQVANWDGDRSLLPVSTWTSLSEDDIWLSHLLRLFWTWDTTLTRLIHRDLLTDMISTRGGRVSSLDSKFVDQFCSEILINSILAYSSNCFAPASNNKPPIQGHEFATEAYRLLETQSMQSCISLLQALAVLSLYEQAFGDSQRGFKLFFDSLLTRRSTLSPLNEDLLPDDPDIRHKVQEALSLISSGFYCLDVKMCLIASPLVPSGWTSRLLASDGPGPNTQRHIDTLWIPYPIPMPPRITYAAEALQIEYDLARLTAECLEATEVNMQVLMPNHLGAVNIYNRLLNWREGNARRFYGSSAILPSLRGILVLYHTTCIKLLGPFIPLPFLDFPLGKSAVALSLEHSVSIISILKEYSALFSTRQDYWLLHTCGVAVENLLLDKNPRGLREDFLVKGCDLIYTIGTYIPQANRVLLEIGKRVDEMGIKIPDRVKRTLHAGCVRIRPTVIENASYLSLEDDGAREAPIKRVTFNENIRKTEF